MRKLEVQRGNTFEALVRALDREPQMVFIRPAAEEPPRVPVDARDVYPAVERGVTLLHEREALPGKRLERSVHALLKLILVRQKPRALIIKGKLPEKLAGLFAEALKHAVIPSF